MADLKTKTPLEIITPSGKRITIPVGRKVQLPREAVTALTEDGAVALAYPKQKPVRGGVYPKTNVQIGLLQPVEGLGQGGEIVTVDFLTGSFLVNNKLGMPERLFSAYWREQGLKANKGVQA